MVITLRVQENDVDLMRALAASNNETVSTYIRRLIHQDMEAQYIRVYEKYLSFEEKRRQGYGLHTETDSCN